jgi:SAM-dependent methyltransferase
MNESPNKWYADWQSAEHVRFFDFRSAMSAANLIRHYETLNDVQLLNRRVREAAGSGAFLEIGCATGEFFRYLRLKWPEITYCGADISQPAIERALGKYPEGKFFASAPSDVNLVSALGLEGKPEFLYAKDVVHHQTDPFAFMERLIGTATHTLVMRLRTRDKGATVFDPELSCQYHYDGWMPYIVINVDEVVERILAIEPAAELIVQRHHIVLGGLYNRYLPRDCYLVETGTAETAVAVFLDTNHPGRVTIEDRPESDPSYTLPHMFGAVLRKVRSVLVRREP